MIATDPGFGFKRTETYFVYSRKASESISCWAILAVFDLKTWTLIGIFFFILLLILTSSFGKQIGLNSFTWSIVVLIKALLAQSLDMKFIERISKAKQSKYIMIWSISLLGGILFWHFEGVLISLLTVPSNSPVIEKLDDLRSKQSFVLHYLKSGYMETSTNNWARENSVHREIYERFIVPNGKMSEEKFIEAIKAMPEKNDPNEALLVSKSGFESMLRKGKGT